MVICNNDTRYLVDGKMVFYTSRADGFKKTKIQEKKWEYGGYYLSISPEVTEYKPKLQEG